MIGIFGWRGPDEGDIKLPPPPPPPPPPVDHLAEMRSALAFAAKLLRDELGPGGFMQREPEASRAIWEEAAQCLETAGDFPMIPVYEWRMRNCRHHNLRRSGSHTLRNCEDAR